MHQKQPPSERTRIKRVSERANYDLAAIHAVLDEAFFGTIAFNDGVSVHAIPTAIWREGEYLYIHGSNGSRLLKCLQTGAEVCVAVTHIHGLVLARSAFHHSMNYSSVCIYGVFEKVADAEKMQHMQRFLEHWMPGRWQHTRLPDKNELAATTIMRVSIVEAAAKSRQGSPKDDGIDMEQAVWAGVVPLRLQWQAPEQEAIQQGADLPGLSVRALA
ncbi:MAG TPA: pyridoxamine 5'-phosphate oxidase family protein [Gammaproteobacteria bacterium]|nr:pyridoxamine 5'-phosphate oxidase family protein [Gammaproteobacteria bacterium]